VKLIKKETNGYGVEVEMFYNEWCIKNPISILLRDVDTGYTIGTTLHPTIEKANEIFDIYIRG